ncbi:hypothetical protein ACVWWG_009349 [Bradyrhizobium sp. LB7.2]
MRALAFAPIRRVLAWNGEPTRRALQRGKVPSFTAKAGALPAAVPPSKPHDHRLRTCRARTARPRRQPAYRDDKGLWRTVGSQAAQHPGSSGPRAGRRSSLGTGLRTCYPSRVSYADHPPCHPGLLGPTLHATGGTKKAAGMAARRARGRPEPVGRSVSPKPVSANPVRKERHLFIFVERATMRINGGAVHFPLAAEGECRCSRRRLPQLRLLDAFQHPGRTAPRVFRAGLGSVVLKPRKRGRGHRRGCGRPGRIEVS